jgi:hypothetical protein
MRMRTLLTLFLLVGLLLNGCSALNPPEKKGKAAIDDFMYALRWQLYPEAAAFFTREPGEVFLDQMEGLKDLNVTEVRLKRIELKDEGRRADTLLEMDYYILPSTTLKTLRINQSWQWFETKDGGQQGFLITTPFPKFP